MTTEFHPNKKCRYPDVCPQAHFCMDSWHCASESELIHFKVITHSDVEQFRSVRLDALKNNPMPLLDVYEIEKAKPISDYLSLLSKHVVTGAYAKEKLVGTTFATIFAQPRLSHKAIIWGTYVDQSVRGKNVGRNMQLASFKNLKENHGIRQCIAAVVADNVAALKMNYSIGFFQTYLERDGIQNPNGEGYSDLVHIMKYLDD